MKTGRRRRPLACRNRNRNRNRGRGRDRNRRPATFTFTRVCRLFHSFHSRISLSRPRPWPRDSRRDRLTISPPLLFSSLLFSSFYFVSFRFVSLGPRLALLGDPTEREREREREKKRKQNKHVAYEPARRNTRSTTVERFSPSQLSGSRGRPSVPAYRGTGDRPLKFQCTHSLSNSTRLDSIGYLLLPLVTTNESPVVIAISSIDRLSYRRRMVRHFYLATSVLYLVYICTMRHNDPSFILVITVSDYLKKKKKKSNQI